MLPILLHREDDFACQTHLLKANFLTAAVPCHFFVFRHCIYILLNVYLMHYSAAIQLLSVSIFKHASIKNKHPMGSEAQLA